jgi:hypothetical protein
MTMSVPVGWKRITKHGLRETLKYSEDYTREAFCGGYFYTRKRTRKRFAAVLDDGQIFCGEEL